MIASDFAECIVQAEYTVVLKALYLSALHASAHHGAYLPAGTRQSSRRCTCTTCHEKVCSRRRSDRAACPVLTTAPYLRPQVCSRRRSLSRRLRLPVVTASRPPSMLGPSCFVNGPVTRMPPHSARHLHA